MFVAKLTRSVLFNKSVHKNLYGAIKVLDQQQIVFHRHSSHLVDSKAAILKDVTPKCVTLTLVSNYSTEKGKVEGLFKSIEKSLNPDIVKKVNSVYQFVLSGEEEGKWFLDLKNEGGKYGKGEPPQAADCTLSMDSKNFLKMFDGKLKPSAAYMTGRLKIKGNLQVALKLEKIMGQLKAKS